MCKKRLADIMQIIEGYNRPENNCMKLNISECKVPECNITEFKNRNIQIPCCKISVYNIPNVIET